MNRNGKSLFSLAGAVILLGIGFVLLNYSKNTENPADNPTNGNNQTKQPKSLSN